MKLPTPRGPLSDSIIDHLGSDRPFTDEDLRRGLGAVTGEGDPLSDDDLQLALAVCYELHYRGFDGVDDDWEWDLGLLAQRALLEARFQAALRAAVPAVPDDDVPIDEALRAVLAAGDGPSVSRNLMQHGTVDHYRDFLRQRSVYHLKEADPHSWAIPRLGGRAKAALVEIQTDEYGGGNPARMHATMFAQTMRALNLDDTYGAYWDDAYAITLATVNVMSMFGLHRSFRGAIVGHLAALEMDSTVPNRRYAAGLRRLGLGRAATAFFDEHVEADAVHEQVAAVDLCGSLVSDDPQLRADVLWGAACCCYLDAAAGRRMLADWQPDQEEDLR